MHCHDFRRLIQEQLSGTLDTSLEKDFQQHLENCASCAREWQHWYRAELLLRQGVKEIMAEIPVPGELSHRVLVACRNVPAGQAPRQRSSSFAGWVPYVAAAALLLVLALGGSYDWLKKELVTGPRLAAGLMTARTTGSEQQVDLSAPVEKSSLTDEKLAGRRHQIREQAADAAIGREEGRDGGPVVAAVTGGPQRELSVASGEVVARKLPAETGTFRLPVNQDAGQQPVALAVQEKAVVQRGAVARPVQALAAAPDPEEVARQQAAPESEQVGSTGVLPVPLRQEIGKGAIFKVYLVQDQTVVWGKQTLAAAGAAPLSLHRGDQLTPERARVWQYNQYRGVLWELDDGYTVLNWQRGGFVYSLEGTRLADSPGELLEFFWRQE
ncbi:MAG: anti-sigma factor family protein [Desulfurispora sp.]|uniref:anti-sigma factor family protein n=1 Tax=Desulfurispora sp. TaxID=3014275 RepID=UPI004049F4FF